MSGPQPYEEEGSSVETKRRKDFDCPECNANNPYDEGFGPGDEVRCFYCGMEYKVELTQEGKWRFREI
jgi:transcription elongation factor Elf1